MKLMKTKITMLFITLLMCVMLVPAVKAEAAAAKPETPSGLGLYSQKEELFGLSWDYDANLNYYSDVYPGYFGWEVQVTTLKNKQITTIDSDYYPNDFKTNGSKIVALISNTKMKTQGFKFKVRSYVYDENAQKVYSDFSKEKIIIPRPTITSKALKGGKVKVTWKKVSGAKNYTIYLSSNEGQSYKKIGTSKKTSYTIQKKLSKYKNYYVYIQANSVKYKGKKYNSTKPADKTSNSSGFYIYETYRY
ncbi:MAG: hypothetical protein PUC12_08790 [Clostridiales bacterium]|nr:hypothetical protein [Clostridiales bacterium]